MDPGSAVAVFAPLAAVMAAYSLGKVPVVPAAATAPAPEAAITTAAPAPAPEAAITTAAPPTAASSLGDIPLAAAPAAADAAISSQESSQSDDPVDDIVQQAITNAKEEQVKSAANFKANRDAAEAQAERERTQRYGGKRSKRRRTRRVKGGDLPGEKEMKVLSVKLKKALLELTLGSKTPREPFMKLITVTGDQEVALRLLPIFTTFIDWRAGVLSTRRVFAANEYQKKFAEALFADVRSKFEEINPVFRDRPPIKLSEAELKEIKDRNLRVAIMEQNATGSPNGVPPAAEAAAPAPAPPGAAVVQTTGEPAAGTGLFAAPAAPVAEPAAPVPDTAAIQEAEARVREEAVASQAAAVAAAKAAAIEERTAAVQATEKRIREEAAASQATLEARALAAENALELNKGDVAKKATELVELRASAKNHEDAAHAAAAAALEQEARAQLAEGQLNAAKEALQMLSADQSTSSVSRVRSLAESEANMRTLEENQRIAEAQAKAARVGAPLTTGVGSSSEVLDKFEAPATPPMAAPPVQPAAAAASASEADQIVTMAEQYAERARAAERAQREQTEKTIADEVIATKLAAAAAAAEATAAQVTLERIKRLDGELEQVFIDPNIARRERLDAARTSALLLRKLQPGDAAVRPPLSASPPPPPVAVKTSTVEFDKQLESLNQQLTNRKAERSHAGLPGTFGYKRKDVEVKELEKRIEQIESLKKTASKGGRRRKTSKKRKTRKPRKSTFRRHRKH